MTFICEILITLVNLSAIIIDRDPKLASITCVAGEFYSVRWLRCCARAT
jgi:hypothetical protein